MAGHKTRPVAETAAEAYKFMVGVRRQDARDFRVKVYWNLTKKMWSVMYRGQVVLHAKELNLCNAIGHVSQAGRRRVLNEKRKNVHAFVIGEICLLPQDLGSKVAKEGRRVTYNPYKWDKFMTFRKTGKRHSGAEGLDVLETIPWMGDNVCVLQLGAEVKGLSDIDESEMWYAKRDKSDDYV